MVLPDEAEAAATSFASHRLASHWYGNRWEYAAGLGAAPEELPARDVCYETVIVGGARAEFGGIRP